MSNKKYDNSNRVGVARGSYNKEWTFGGIVVGKRGKSTDLAFLKKVYELNKQQLDSIYQSNINRIKKAMFSSDPKRVDTAKATYESFTKTYGNAEQYFIKRVSGYQKNLKISALQAVKHATKQEFGEEVDRFRNNLIQGMKTSGIYNDFVQTIGEPLNKNKLKYIGDGTYQYTTDKGQTVSISVSTSPLTYRLIETE